MEPQLQCVEAVLSPQTGIVDSHQFMLALQGDAERDGANIAFHTPVTAIDAREGCFIIETGGDTPTRLRAARVDQQRGPACERTSRARFAASTTATCRRSTSRRATTSA